MDNRIIKYRLDIMPLQEKLIFEQELSNNVSLKEQLYEHDLIDKHMRSAMLHTVDASFLQRLKRNIIREMVIPDVALLHSNKLIAFIIGSFVVLGAILIYFSASLPSTSALTNYLDPKSMSIFAMVSIAFYSLFGFEFIVKQLKHERHR